VLIGADGHISAAIGRCQIPPIDQLPKQRKEGSSAALYPIEVKSAVEYA